MAVANSRGEIAERFCLKAQPGTDLEPEGQIQQLEETRM